MLGVICAIVAAVSIVFAFDCSFTNCKVDYVRLGKGIGLLLIFIVIYLTWDDRKKEIRDGDVVKLAAWKQVALIAFAVLSAAIVGFVIIRGMLI